MFESVLGWPNGVVGFFLGVITGLLMIVRAWRASAWDIHEEKSWYSEPARVTVGVVAPAAIMYAVLVTLLLGVAVLDRGVWPPFAMAADVLGMLILPLALIRLVKRTD